MGSRPYSKPGLIPDRFWQNLIKVGLIGQGLLIGLVLDLVDQNVLGPAKITGHVQVKLSLGGLCTSP